MSWERDRDAAWRDKQRQGATEKKEAEMIREFKASLERGIFERQTGIVVGTNFQQFTYKSELEMLEEALAESDRILAHWK